VIVADTGAVLALVDADDRHHAAIRSLYMEAPDAWVLPWAILPEVDYLLATHVGPRAEAAWLADLADAAFRIEWGRQADLAAARAIHERYRALRLGLVEATVIAVAERLRADAIATLDVKRFGAVRIAGNPRLLPRDGQTS
jgi:predicted nucleic acid-binding protein